MFQDLFQAMLLAQRDHGQIAVVNQLAPQIVSLPDEGIDQFLLRLTDFGDELRDSGQEKEPPCSATDSLSEPMQPGMDKVFLPLVRQLIVREHQRRIASNLNRPQRAGLKTDEGKKLDSLSDASGTEPDLAHSRLDSDSDGWSERRSDLVEQLYRLSPVASDLRNHFLHWLAISLQPRAMHLWVQLISDDPPEYRPGIGLAFAPLLQERFVLTKNQLERLLNRATAHSQIAPAVFELFNFYVREGLLERHPAESRLNSLAELLGQLCRQMLKIEQGDFSLNQDANQINQQVSDSVSLIVALCDMFALTGFQPATSSVHQALKLRHRRVQTEAAAALARLGDEEGKASLIALAEQPVARLRVLAYAEELGFKNQISLELQGDIARAESKLAIWLAEPAQIGLAPSQLELVDHRELFWPSYEDPVECYLFRYEYGTGNHAHSNIGICGPLTHAFAADLRHLPVEEIYAAFAGWQAVHDEIFQMSPARAKQVFPNEMRRLERGLEDETLNQVKIQSVGSFFGQLVLVASAHCEGQNGTLIVDDHDSTWFDCGNPEAPIDWKMAFGIWRGKQLLNRFNLGEPL